MDSTLPPNQPSELMSKSKSKDVVTDALADEKALSSTEVYLTALTPLTGWRWTGMAASLCLGILLSVIEQSISATALVSIGRYFDDFLTTTWVILAYLLGNIGFAIVFPRLSDVIGRKASLMAAWVTFAAFSLGAGLSHNLTALIICRAFQGIGGTGLYGLAMVVFPQITPIPRWGLMGSLAGVVFAIASVIGPVLGGVITEESTWRWIYLFNAPFAGLGVFLLVICWPKDHGGKKHREPWNSIDVFGALLLVAASCLLVFALQEAGATTYAWNSRTIIASLTVSGLCWIAFIVWVAAFSIYKLGPVKPIFPTSIAASRPSGPAMAVAFFTGFSQLVPIITLAERFQIVNRQTPILAGVRLMPLLSFVALGSMIGGILTSKKNRTSELTVLASCLVIIGTGLMSTLNDSAPIEAKQYGFQILLGLGTGTVFTALTLMLNLANDFGKVAAAQGAINQMRQLGGSIGLAVFSIILNQKFDAELGGTLSQQQINDLKRSLSTLVNLSEQQQAVVGTIFAKAFSEEMRVCMYLAIGGLLAAIATYQKNPASVAAAQEKQRAMMQRQIATKQQLSQDTEIM